MAQKPRRPCRSRGRRPSAPARAGPRRSAPIRAGARRSRHSPCFNFLYEAGMARCRERR